MSNLKLRFLAVFFATTGIYLAFFDKIPFGAPWAVVCLAGFIWVVKFLYQRTFSKM